MIKSWQFLQAGLAPFNWWTAALWTIHGLHAWSHKTSQNYAKCATS